MTLVWCPHACQSPKNPLLDSCFVQASYPIINVIADTYTCQLQVFITSTYKYWHSWHSLILHFLEVGTKYHLHFCEQRVLMVVVQLWAGQFHSVGLPLSRVYSICPHTWRDLSQCLSQWPQQVCRIHLVLCLASKTNLTLQAAFAALLTQSFLAWQCVSLVKLVSLSDLTSTTQCVSVHQKQTVGRHHLYPLLYKFHMWCRRWYPVWYPWAVHKNIWLPK